MFPIVDADIWKMYKKQMDCFWRAEEIDLSKDIKHWVTLNDNEIAVDRPTNQKSDCALHGLTRSLINNMVIGVSKGWTKELEFVGVGYRAKAQGQKLDLAVGFSHNIVMDIAEEVKVEAVTEKGQNPIVKLTSFDKQLVGQVAAKIRSFRKPEPYKGKGIRFVGEHIRRKAGKSA